YRPTVAQEMGGDHSINKASSVLNRRSSSRGVVRGNFISSLLLNETGNGGAILTCAASTQPSHFLVNLI
ncbi:hypothetical protein, partial [Klebsiella pneumoniae]|uniref:hypothetical protein n=1 Tax=Klebsiella pneumoniae TaxID=573 RepID=UPI0039C473AA